MELYEVALQMLLERRDSERKIQTVQGLNRTEKLLILSNIAYWLMRNGLSDAPVQRVLNQIRGRLVGMSGVRASAEEVYRHLLERTGLLREPVEGHVDFIHRTFQEYLAARAIVFELDDVAGLVSNAALDQWHEVVVMAVGHAPLPRREELLLGILNRADKEPNRSHQLQLLAIACLETAPELSPSLLTDVQNRAARLLPPKSVTEAKAFGAAGDFVLDLLFNAEAKNVFNAEAKNAREAAATIRSAIENGSDAAMLLIARYRLDTRESVQREIIAGWSRFDPEAYASRVLADSPVRTLSVEQAELVPALRYLSNLQTLSVVVPPERSLDFVPSGVEVLRVVAKGPVDISALRVAHLREFRIRLSQKQSNVNVANVVDGRTLETLDISAQWVGGLRELEKCSSLRRLSLQEVNFSGLQLGSSESIRGLAIRHADGLATLGHLASILNPHEVQISACEQVRYLDCPPSWTHTLRKLIVRDCGLVNVSGIRRLRGLRYIDLCGCAVEDLGALCDSQSLRVIVIDAFANPRDMLPLSRLRNVELRIRSARPLSLAPLAGVSNVRLKIDAPHVTGQEMLGARCHLVPKRLDDDDWRLLDWTLPVLRG
jgi:hypothetical protein